MIVPASNASRASSQRANAARLLRPVTLATSAGGSSWGWKPRSDTPSPSRPKRRRDAHGDQPVERDRADEQTARERLAPERRHVDDDEGAVDRIQQQRTKRRAE